MRPAALACQYRSRRLVAVLLLTVALACLIPAFAQATDKATDGPALPPQSLGEASADAAAQPQPMPFLGGFLKETRILYPLSLGDWHAVGEHLYEQQELGVSVRYVHDDDQDRWIDLYFYPAGALSAAQFTEAAASERAEILSLAGRPGAYETLAMGELRKFQFTVADANRKREPRQGYSVDMTYTREGARKNSAMTLLIDRLYFIKGRFSIDADRMSRDAARSLLEEFMARLVPKLQLVSSGGCWMAPPIVARPAPLDTSGEDVVATDKGKAGAITAVGRVGRVEALDPASKEAQVMQVVVMLMTDRLFPGCTSAEPTNPEVPAGFREIRLEYRAPATEGAPPSDRTLRPARSGVG